MSTGRVRSTGRSRWRAPAVALAVVAAAGAGTAALGDEVVAAPRPAATTPPVPAVSPPVGRPGVEPVPPGGTALERGRLLYGANCASCHGQTAEGTGRGPDLRSVGTASTDFQLRTGRMPVAEPDEQPRSGPPAFGPDDIEALVAYVGSLGDGSGPSIPVLGAGDAARGRTVYLANCAACHSSSGVGAALPSGHVAPSLLDTATTQLGEAVRTGPGLMPQFPDTLLSDADVADVAAYVDDLAERRDQGGWPLGGIGPVPEGAVGWVLGLGTLLVVIRLLGRRAE